MAQSLLSPSIIAKEGLVQLRNNLVLGANCHREYKNEFVKVGSSISIRRPVKFTVTDGATRSNQDVEEGSTTLTVNSRKHVSWSFNSQDMTQKIEMYSERYMQPAGIVLANKCDLDIAANYYKFYHTAGTPGTTPNAFSYMGDLATVLDEGAVPDDGRRNLVLNPAARWAMADALKGVYDRDIPGDVIRRGYLGPLAQFKVFGDQNIAKHTTGTNSDDASILIDGGNLSQSYSTSTDVGTIHVDGLDSATGTFTAGDTFTIADVYAVNPISKVSTGELQRFTVAAAVTAASSECDVTMRPRIITSGPYQTVNAAAVDGAAVTCLGTASTAYPQNLGYHRNALALVMCPLDLPDSAGFKARATEDGTSIRVIKDYDIDNDEEIIRMDILYGTDAIYPELGGRLWG